MSDQPEPNEIKNIRDDIDRVDAEIMRLLAERRSHSRRIAHTKGAHHPTRDRGREEDLIAERLAVAGEHDLDSALVIQLWRTIMNDSVTIQQEVLGRGDLEAESLVVSIQGVEGSYSHLASEQFFGAKGIEASYVNGVSMADAIEQVTSGRADVAVMPIENSTSGAISDVYDLLLESSLHVVGETSLRVRHCLLGVQGGSIADLRKVYGHPQAIAQCSEFLAGLDGVEVVWFSDTALSGKKIAEMNDRSVAAIASEEAARLYGLQVLKTGIANREGNTTRFLVLSQTPVEVPDGVPAKTSMVMAVGNRPGALMRALSVFRDADINLVKLESRPIPSNPQEELFYVDFAGNIADETVGEAIDALTRQVRFLRVLGSYPSRNLRERPVASVPTMSPESRGAIDVPHSSAKPSGYKLGSRGHKEANTIVEVAGVELGGDTLTMIAGPCAVESWDQMVAAARGVRDAGAALLRGGCFKPRTSPYSFQGLGFEGLEMLAEAGKAFGMPIVTEVLSPEHVERVAEKADVLQIGTRNMQNFSLLQAVGRSHRPVLLKRGMSSSIDELLQAAEYILAEGNQQVILCERGIRTFETSTRNTLDISAVPVLKSRTHLPVIVDPSHAAGSRDLVAPMSLAAQAVGADGIMVEVHPNPEEALSDGPQSLRLDQFDDLMAALGMPRRA